MTATQEPRTAHRAVDACQWSGPARGWRRDLMEGERRWMAEWDRYLAARRDPLVVAAPSARDSPTPGGGGPGRGAW